MAKVFIEETTLTAIGDAIRGKEGTTALVPVNDMATRITSLPSGGGGGNEPTDEELTLTGHCGYRFYYGGWNWVIQKYANRITTRDISDARSMFYGSDLEHIPFELNFNSKGGVHSLDSLFKDCTQLKEIPKLNNCRPDGTQSTFERCEMLRYLPEDVENWFDWSYVISNKGNRSSCVRYCRSLRKLPANFLSHFSTNVLPNYSIYYYAFDGCNALDEITNLPVQTAPWKNNAFTNTFRDCLRVKNVTFKTNEDGTPIVTMWKSQTIDLSKNVGWSGGGGSADSYILNYNSGITADKRMYGDTYQALKNDPDAYATAPNWSRYDKASAVATINSLPDTSAYLAANGGTNTIKFDADSGSETDAGAISTLTEAEIAVATAKGWTVTLV